MPTFEKSKLGVALQLALIAGVCQQASAEPFPARLNLSTLDGTSGVIITGASAGDASGFSVSAAGDINGDGISDVTIGAYRAETTLGGVDAGLTYIVYGSDQTFISPIALDDFSTPSPFRAFGEENSQGVCFSGHSVSGAGDFNNDGFDDYLIGAPGNIPGLPLEDTEGRAYLGFGSQFLSNTFLGSFNGSSGFKINAESTLDNAIGYSVSRAGDFNGDGIDDVLIGATRADLAGDGRGGRAYILFGTSSITAPFEFNLNTLDGSNGVVISKAATSSLLGFSASPIGDFNGDGQDDVIIGAPGSTTNGNNSGSSYIVFGTNEPTNPIQLDSLDGTNGLVVHGETANDRSGSSVHAAGDMNGDGFDDVIIGAPYSSGGLSFAGRSYVIFGTDQTIATPLELSSLDGSAGFAIEGAEANDFAGTSVAGGSDLNGDGLDDLVIGATGADSLDSMGDINDTDTGVVHVVFGSSQLSHPFQLGDLDGSNGFTINGAARLDRLGHSVDFAGDVNADGTEDLIIGAYGSDGNGDDSGTSYIVFGRSLNDLAISKSNGTGALDPGQITTWRIEVSNLGPYTVNDALVTDHVPDGIINASWTCAAFDGASCSNASGPGAINELVDLPASSSIVFELTGTVNVDEPNVIINFVEVQMPGTSIDVNLANNIAIDSDPIGLFTDGFEDNN